MSIALSGWVIIEEKHNILRYCRKCEKCGNTSATYTTASIKGKYTKRKTSFRCSKCGNKQEVVIQGE